MGVAGLDGRVEAAQVVPVGPGHVGLIQGVQDRLVVFVNQHDNGPASLPVQRPDQVAEASRRGVVTGADTGCFLLVFQLCHHILVQIPRLAGAPSAKVEPHDGIPYGPVPVLVDVQPLEQGFVALEELLAGVEEQALAEAPRPGEEVMLAPVNQPANVHGLVDVVAVLLADLAEGLNAYGEPASGHGHHSGSLKLPLACRGLPLFARVRSFAVSIRSEGFKVPVPQFGFGDERVYRKRFRPFRQLRTQVAYQA